MKTNGQIRSHRTERNHPRFETRNTTPSATRKYPKAARRRSAASGSDGAGVETTVA
jgi:hypothetical protein